MAKLISSEQIPAELIPKLNKVKHRILFLSPSVTSGHEREACQSDFESLTKTTIGSGGFGKVYKVKHKTSQNIYALKVINKKKIIEEDLSEQIGLEIRIMYSLDHEHIVKLYNHFEDDNFCYLLLEYVPNGHLYKRLKHVGRFLESDAAQHLREVISAVEYLHSLNPPIIHRDIKPENILLDDKNSTKLCDFGWSNFFNPNRIRKTYCGTPDYLSPEMIAQEGHDQRLDIWNLGVLLFEMLTGQPPFSGDNQRDLFENILKVKINYPKDFPRLAKDLVSKLLKSRPKDRLSLRGILEHPWMKSKPPIRPILTREIRMEMKLPTLNQDLEEKEYEPVSKASKKNCGTKNKYKLTLQLDNHLSAKTKAEKEEFINDLCDQIKHKTKELNDQRGKYETLFNEYKSIKQENEDLKTHLGVSKKGYMSNEKLEIRKLIEELNKLKAVNKDREEIIQNLVKTKEKLTESLNRTRILENEIEVLHETKKSLEQKVNELQGKLENAEKNYMKLKQENEQQILNNARMKAEFETQIHELQYKVPVTEASKGYMDASSLEVMKNCSVILESIKKKMKTEMSYKKTVEAIIADLAEEKKKYIELKNKYDAKTNECDQAITKGIEEIKRKSEYEKQSEIEKRDKVIEELKGKLRKSEIQEEKRLSESNMIESLRAQNQQFLKLSNDLKSQVALYSKEQKYLRQRIKSSSTKIEDLEFQLERKEEKLERNNST